MLDEILTRSHKHERVLVTTLTKRMAEELTEYLLNHNVKANYIHSDVATLDRVKIMNDLRAGVYDVLVGVNLLREVSTCRRCRSSPYSTLTRKGSCEVTVA